MALPEIKVEGRLTADPTTRITTNGTTLTSFTIASNNRSYNQDTKKWEDKNTTYTSVVVFGDKATLVADMLQKGDPVTVTGTPEARGWIKDDEVRTTISVTAKAVYIDMLKPNQIFRQEVIGQQDEVSQYEDAYEMQGLTF